MNTDIPNDIFKKFDEQQRIDEEYNEIVSSLSFADFKKRYSLIFIGYDYYPPQYDGKKVYTFQDIDDNLTKVFNMTGATIGQMLMHESSFSVVKRKTGYYEFIEEGVSLNADKKIVMAFEDEWLEYEEVKEKLSIEAEQKRRKRGIQRQKSRNADRFPYDLSGDDLSLDPDMW